MDNNGYLHSPHFFITPNWPAPKNIRAYCTTRLGGVSLAPYNNFNLATHVEDNIEAVLANRKILQTQLQLPSQPNWLNQQHTNIIQTDINYNINSLADGFYTQKINSIAAILTADCLPILLTNLSGTEVAAVHGGWKGLAKNIIKKAVSHFHSKPDELIAWLGPCISQANYEINAEVKNAFDQSLHSAFIPSPRNNHYLCCLKTIAKLQLELLGVNNITIDPSCTYSDPKLFYSYRRENKTGRIATLIYRGK